MARGNRFSLDGPGSVLTPLARFNIRPRLAARGGDLLLQIPSNLNKVKKENLNREILGAAIMAGLDTINLYDQMAALTDAPDSGKVLLDIAGEERPRGRLRNHAAALGPGTAVHGPLAHP